MTELFTSRRIESLVVAGLGAAVAAGGIVALA
jgi:hypothetical protein